MTDRYTKAVLTVIAVALCGLVVQNAVKLAGAVGEGCGSDWLDPCFVKVVQ